MLATSVRRYAMSTDTLAVVAAFNAAWSAHDLDATLALWCGGATTGPTVTCEASTCSEYAKER